MYLISKWIWRCAKERSSLWRSIIKQKHGMENGNVFPKVPRISHGVGLWKFISQQTSLIHDHASFVVGNGQSIRFWIDKWCHSSPLKLLAPNLFGIVKRKQALVSEVVKLSHGLASINLQFYAAIDYEFMGEIVTVHNLVFAHPLDLSKEDELVWDGDSDDDGFSVSSVYNKLQATVSPSLDFPFKKVWKKGIPLKCQFLAWTAVLNRIATFDLMKKRRIIWVNYCPLCIRDQETSAHLFIHCTFAREVWCLFLQIFEVQWIMPDSVLSLFEQWSRPGLSRRGRILWSYLPHALLWAIWAERNNRCFNDVVGSPQQVFAATKGILWYWCLDSKQFTGWSLENFLIAFERVISL